MNVVRRHLSALKGGRLAALCHPAKLVTLLQHRDPYVRVTAATALADSFVWAAGSILGPILQGPLVDRVGVGGMFWFASAGAVLIAAAMFWRRRSREASEQSLKEEFAPQLGTSVAAAELAYGEDKPQ